MKEIIWKKITHPDVISDMYLVSENGDIKSAITGNILKPIITASKYKLVELRTIHNKRLMFKVHELVAHEFCNTGDFNAYNSVYAIDNDYLNTHYTNLQYGSGDGPSFKQRNKAKNDINFVHHVCSLLEKGYSIYEIFKMFAPEYATRDDYIYLYNRIRAIQYGLSNKDISRQYNIPKKDPYKNSKMYEDFDPSTFQYGEETLRKICEGLQNNESVSAMARNIVGNSPSFYEYNTDFNTLRHMITLIKKGKSWINISKDYDIDSIPQEIKDEAKRIYKMYNECDFFIKAMIDNGASDIEVLNAYGVYLYPDDEKFINKLKSMINNYRTIKSLPKDVIIKERVK